MSPVAESPRSQVTSGSRKNIPDLCPRGCSPRGIGLVSLRVSKEVKVAARENRELELIGASFQPQGPRPTRSSPERLQKGRDHPFASLWSRGDSRGNAEVKPRAAGGARSTRSVGGSRLQLRTSETSPEIRAPNPGSSARSCPVARGFHAPPPFLPLPPG